MEWTKRQINALFEGVRCYGTQDWHTLVDSKEILRKEFSADECLLKWDELCNIPTDDEDNPDIAPRVMQALQKRNIKVKKEQDKRRTQEDRAITDRLIRCGLYFDLPFVEIDWSKTAAGILLCLCLF